eukprot:70961_1
MCQCAYLFHQCGTQQDKHTFIGFGELVSIIVAIVGFLVNIFDELKNPLLWVVFGGGVAACCFWEFSYKAGCCGIIGCDGRTKKAMCSRLIALLITIACFIVDMVIIIQKFHQI